ncbi:MAG: L,D-transpeptidase family protein [Alphaproteobacteria bacterium]|nr:L,D-transpeptidase family protein [Alphaproteobacteria bacterium]
MVFKSERRLYLMQGFRPIKGYDVALGFAPIGHKERQGDGRTPEGLYTIDAKNPASQFHLSLRVSYPGGTDVARARRFRESPGGDIMIHGLPNTDERNVARHHPFWDWTWGCIAVTNEEIREIWDVVQVGTTIEILP